MEVIALSIAIIAPTFAMSMNVGLMAGTVSYSVSLMFVISTILMGFVAVSFVKFNQYFSSAGSVYTFVDRSMGKNAAAVSGWFLTFAYTCFACGCSCAFGSLFQEFVKEVTGVSIPWVVFALLCELVIFAIAFTDVTLSTKVMLTIEGVSIALIIILAAVILVKVSMAGKMSFAAFQVGDNKLSNFGAGIVFAILCFGGFEGASSLGEESKNPKKTIPLAIASTVIGTGVIFIFVSFAETVGFGTTDAGLKAFTTSPSTIVDLSEKYMGKVFTAVITLGICMSAFSTALGSMTAGCRAFYSMSRDGNAPEILSAVHPKHRSPYVALILMLVISVIPTVSLVQLDGSTVFGIVGTAGAMSLLLAYLMTSLGSILYFGKRRIWTWQLIFPTVSLVILGYAFYSNIYPVPAFPVNILPYIVIAWTVAGCAVTYYCRKRASESSVSLKNEDASF